MGCYDGYSIRVLEAPPQPQSAIAVVAEAERKDLLRRLLLAQNADGGWGFHTRQSWTEPTALALLALQAAGYKDSASERAIAWLLRQRRPDGGWAPTPSVEASTWVTSIAFLSIQEHLSPEQWSSSLLWVKGATIHPLGHAEAAVFKVFGLQPAKLPGGVPWFPGTAGWVIPTALNLICLSFALHQSPDSDLKNLIIESRRFLLSRRCLDGGWNHGGSSFRSENARSYPETTALALLALGGSDPNELRRVIELGRQFASEPGSAEGAAWLKLALTKHDLPDCAAAISPQHCRDARDLALCVLSLNPGSDRNRLMAA